MQFLRITVVFSLVLFPFYSAADDSCFNHLDQLASAVVKIRMSDNNTASGVVVSPNHVLTVLHALPINSSPIIEFEYHVARADLVSTHHGYDLALLQVNTANSLGLPVVKEGAGLNQNTAAVSYPVSKEFTLSYGQIKNQTYKGLKSSTEISPGSSGGALVVCENNQIKLAGIIRALIARRTETGEPRNTGNSWSIPPEVIRQFLKDNDLNPTWPIIATH